MRKSKGKGKGEIDEQKDREERWRVKKDKWMNEQWERMSEDDLGMGQTGQRLRQEQWEAVRAMKLRNEMLKMAECLGEEMASELGKGSWRRARDSGMERRRERGGESPVGQGGDDSVEEKTRRLNERIDELEGREKGKGEGRVAKGSSSVSGESGERWRWDGRAWRLRRRVSRAVRVAWSRNLRDGEKGWLD